MSVEWLDQDDGDWETMMMRGRPTDLETNPVVITRHHPVIFEGLGATVHACASERHCERIGECGEGCCDDYRCPDCGFEFRVEWPD